MIEIKFRSIVFYIEKLHVRSSYILIGRYNIFIKNCFVYAISCAKI